MKKYLLSFVLVASLAGCVAAPHTSHAYVTTAQSAAVLSGGAAYTVTYHFGSPYYDLYLPIRANRTGSGMATATKALAYTLVDTDGVTTDVGLAKGMVLSDAEIRDGQYFIPRGQAREMTLLVALATSTQKTAALPPREIALQVAALPFVLIDKGKAVAGGLNGHELQHYVTPEAKVYPKR